MLIWKYSFITTQNPNIEAFNEALNSYCIPTYNSAEPRFCLLCGISLNHERLNKKYCKMSHRVQHHLVRTGKLKVMVVKDKKKYGRSAF